MTKAPYKAKREEVLIIHENWLRSEAIWNRLNNKLEEDLSLAQEKRTKRRLDKIKKIMIKLETKYWQSKDELFDSLLK